MEESKEDIVSYIPPEKEKRTAYTVLAVEIIVIAIIVVIAFIVLNYFGIFPLSRVSPLLFGFLPVSEESLVSGDYDIEAVSEIPGYKIKLNNEGKLIKLLTDWNVFGKNHDGVYYAEGRTNGTPVNKIVLHLTKEVQKTNKYVDQAGQVYLSSYIIVKPGQLDVYAHLGDMYFNDREKKNEAGIAVLSITLQALYKLDNYLIPFEQRKIRDEQTLNVISEIIKQNSNYFEVVKEK